MATEFRKQLVIREIDKGLLGPTEYAMISVKERVDVQQFASDLHVMGLMVQDGISVYTVGGRKIYARIPADYENQIRSLSEVKELVTSETDLSDTPCKKQNSA